MLKYNLYIYDYNIVIASTFLGIKEDTLLFNTWNEILKKILKSGPGGRKKETRNILNARVRIICILI